MKLALVEQIWKNELQICQEEELSTLAKMLKVLLGQPIVCFNTTEAWKSDQPLAMFGSEELLAGVTLADILDQEYGIEISDETVVLVEAPQLKIAFELGEQAVGMALGNVLVSLARFEEERERSGMKGGNSSSSKPIARQLCA